MGLVPWNQMRKEGLENITFTEHIESERDRETRRACVNGWRNDAVEDLPKGETLIRATTDRKGHNRYCSEGTQRLEEKLESLKYEAASAPRRRNARPHSDSRPDEIAKHYPTPMYAHISSTRTNS